MRYRHMVLVKRSQVDVLDYVISELIKRARESEWREQGK